MLFCRAKTRHGCSQGTWYHMRGVARCREVDLPPNNVFQYLVIVKQKPLRRSVPTLTLLPYASSKEREEFVSETDLNSKYDSRDLGA